MDSGMQSVCVSADLPDQIMCSILPSGVSTRFMLTGLTITVEAD